MPISRRSRWIAVGTLCALLAGAGVAVAGDRRKDRMGKGRRSRAAMVRLTDDQARAAHDAATELARQRMEAGMKLVRTLTPEQRAKIDERAKARGRTVTDEMLARRFGRMLSRPRVRARLLDRIGTPAPAPTPAPETR